MGPSSPTRTGDDPYPLEALRTMESLEHDEADVDAEEIADVAKQRRSRRVADIHFHSTLSYALRLPPELLSEIFVQCPNLTEMRGVVCRICRAWRQIAMSTPRLWTDISLSFLDDRFDENMWLLRTWCDRAGTLPLSVALSSYHLSTDHDPVTALIPYISRVRVMDFQLPRSCLQTICSLPDGSLESLECFTFRQLGVENEKVTGTTTVFASALRLREIAIFDVTLDPDGLCLPRQLTSMSFSCDFPPTVLLRILQACPNLESVKATIDAPSPVEIFPGDTVLLRHCRKLRLEIESGDTFLDHITLPVLEHIEIVCEWPETQLWPHTPFMSLISRSSCHLQTLELSRIEISATELIWCLRILPSLTRLRIEFVELECAPIFDELTYVHGFDQNIVPLLQELVLTVDDEFEDFEEFFAIMLESRYWWNSVTSGIRLLVPASRRLRKATISLPLAGGPDINLKFGQRFVQLQQAGMIVEIFQQWPM
jgi:hypothetical protein